MKTFQDHLEGSSSYNSTTAISENIMRNLDMNRYFGWIVCHFLVVVGIAIHVNDTSRRDCGRQIIGLIVMSNLD